MQSSEPPWRVFDAPSTGQAGTRPAVKARGAPEAAPVPRGVAIAGVGLAALLLAGAVGLVVTGGSGTVAVEVSATAGETAGPGAVTGPGIVVDVGGAVARPGVYRLAAGSRVADAIAAAGGYAPQVDAASIAARLNLAAPLADGQQVLVPSRAGATADVSTGPGIASAGAGAGSSGGTGGTLNLNRATEAELDALPGIGPVTAKKIVASRTETPFATVDDLRTRKLVGQKTFDALRDLVTVR